MANKIRGEVNESGYVKCNCCGKSIFFSDSELCMECEKFSCKSCVKYRRQFPYGYICKKCIEKAGKKLKI